VAELLARTKTTALDALAHQDIPFEQVVDLIASERNLAHNPVFQVAFAWMDRADDCTSAGAIELTPLHVAEKAPAKFDLVLAIEDRGDILQCQLGFASSLFDEATICRWESHLKQALICLSMDDTDQRPVGEVDIVNEQQLDELMGLEEPHPHIHVDGRRIHEYIELQAALIPDAVALSQGDAHVTYADADAIANAIADRIMELGIARGDRVMIHLPRAPLAVLAAIGALKSGAAIVPIDVSLPESRKRQLLDDCGAKVVISGAQDAFPGPDAHSLRMEIGEHPDLLPRRRSSPNGTPVSSLHDPAYVIYTSGSTGEPKGVVVEHASVANLVEAHIGILGTGRGSRVLQFSSPGFDLFIYEIVASLCRGATLCIPDQGVVLVGSELARVVEQHRISHLLLTASALGTLDPCLALDSLGVVMSVGERLPEALAQRWSERVTLWNGYGPTEATAISTAYRCASVDTGEPPIGQPVSNTRGYVLDQNGSRVARGIVGELYVGGAGVARGYLGRPDLDAERFLPDRFSKNAGDRMYRTGDLVRWRNDGNLAYMGRNDRQVKLRGFRIEPAEIEGAILAQGDVRDCAVLIREDAPGNRCLAAYVVPRDQQIDPKGLRDRLRAHLGQALPSYMTPAAWKIMDGFPLTRNGKLDVSLLPPPERWHVEDEQFEVPIGETEELVARIWCDILSLDRVDRHDNFFHLGGNSLMVVRVVSRLAKSGFNVPVATVFRHPVLHEMASNLASLVVTPYSEDAVVIRSGEGAPLFLPHDGSGLLLYAHSLADHLQWPGPILGLPCPCDAMEGLNNVASMASRMIPMIKEKQASGPYYLLGWSFGGLLAYELAASLSKAGEQIAFLGMIDSHLPAGEGKMGQLPMPSEPGAVLHQHRQRLFHLAALDYSPSHSAGVAHLFRATVGLDALAGWRHHPLELRLRVHDCPGDHHGMLRGENLVRLAKAIDSALGFQHGT
ncbi:MAG: amino acid adenylation domain-containing protein, partial [Rhizobium sp.]|nr:amino acid adenylation domain-containing protein [Rhizobium sp.]